MKLRLLGALLALLVQATVVSCGSNPGNSVNDLALDDRGNLWVMTEGGLVRLNRADGSIERFGSRDGIDEGLRDAVVAAPDGTIWIGGHGGVASFDGESVSMHLTEVGSAGPGLAVDSAGQVWATTDDGVLRFDGRGWEVMHGSAAYPYSRRDTIVARQNGDMLARTKNLWLRYDGQRWEPLLYHLDGELSSRARTIAEGLDGTLWASDFVSLIRIQDEKLARIRLEELGFPRDERDCDAEPSGNSDAIAFGVDALTVTAGGTVWAGTCRGVAAFDGHSWTAYTASSVELLPAYVWTSVLVAGPEGELWIGTRGNGVFRFDGDGWQQHNLK